MNRIEAIFAGLRGAGRKGLMPFVCGGYPGPGVVSRLLPELGRAGACVVEIGFPFSDPIADGPVIAAAMHRALEQGCTPASVFAEAAAAREGAGGAMDGVGLVAMVSVSIVWRVGIDEMVLQARRSGVDGFIFPDLPAEEGPELLARVRDAGLCAALLVAPTTSEARAARLVAASSGFVYLLARSGITGESGAAPEIGDRVRRLREMTDLPIACGFGISTAAHVRAVVAHADAAIVGSALVRRMGEAERAGEDVVAAGAGLVRELAAGLG